MPEPMPHRRSTTAWQALVARGAAVLVTAVLAVTMTLPIPASGEGALDSLPASTDTISTVPGIVTTIPLRALIDNDAERELDFDTARLEIPGDLSAAQRELMEVGEDSRSIAVAGEGTWSLIDRDLVFTPVAENDPETPVALTVDTREGGRPEPAVFTPSTLELEEVPARGSAGEPTQVPIEADVAAGGAVRLDLDGLPSGSTMIADGSRVIIPEQGIWQLSSDGTTLTHTPMGPRLGRQIDPVRFVVEDSEGAPVQAGRVAVTVPIIIDQYVSAPFGEDIVFAVGEGQQHVEAQTLQLVPQVGAEGIELDEEGTEAIVPGEGVWSLDRDDATVRFSPESSEVRATAPMGVTGGDGEGATAAPALLSTGYPVLVDRTQSAAPGTPVVFDLAAGIRDVSSESVRFDPRALPEDAEISDDATEVSVPGEGEWRIDLEARSVVVTPEDGVTGALSPIGITGRGVYADNPVSASLEAVYSPVLATLRDDEQRTAPSAPVTIDVLGNDTAGSASQPLVPESVQIRSLSATNLTELEDGMGTRLVLPGEGVYTVDQNGAVTFEPEEGFLGRGTPIEYHVLDSESVPTSANLVVEVDPALEPGADVHAEVSGINSLLIGLLPSSPSSSIVFGTIVLLLLFGGVVSVWIGLRMEADRRTWQD